MVRITIFILLTALIMGSCTTKKDKENGKNPFFTEYETSYKIPPFEEIKKGHFMPAFEKGMKEHKKEIEKIANNSETPTYENTIEEMVYSGKLLDKVSNVFYGLLSANTNDSLQSIAQEVSPKYSKHRDEISMNPELFKRIKSIYDKRDELDLTTEQEYLLEDIYKNFIRSGANLPSDKKEELQEINQKLSSLSLEFGQNELKETNNFEMVIEKEENLAGLPESAIQTAEEKAEEKGYEGKWVFTTHKPSMLPFLQYAKNRDLREKLYKAYLTRGNNDNEYDNKENLSDIVKLRVRKAQLLGYDTYADYTLETRMAEDSEDVMELLRQVWDPALEKAREERAQMQKIIEDEGKDFELKSWDWWYYAEKLRKQKYNLDDSELRPYFELDKVQQGAFDVANKLYGITFTEIEKDVPKPHPDATVFKVEESDGSHVGLLFMDYHPRDSKKGGAWCGSYRSHYQTKDGKEIHPLVTMVMNFTTPTENKPALLSMDEVETLFHEFGHALDGLLADNKYPQTSIPRDFVELPSQIMEHWASHPKVMKDYAKHYETGDPIPDELIKKIEKSGYFNQGFKNVEFTAAAMLDMAYHTLSEPKDLDVMKFEQNYLDEIGLIPEIEPRYHSTYFSHITGGYAAGYYSYMWSAVLDNDAFEAFEKNGIYDQETASKFRYLLEKDGTRDAMELYKKFRGREPKIEPLLKNRGLK
ncbi:MAG: M3 family metallopeptidase [Bacteroidota bacterium]